MNLLKKSISLVLLLCTVISFTVFPASALSYDSQAATKDTYSSMQWDMEMIGMTEARRYGLTGKGVRVAIIDSGVSTGTGDIDSNRLLPGKSYTGTSTDTGDTDGHGTFIAGIIGATNNNNVGIAGIAPGVTIIPLKTMEGGRSYASKNAQAIIDAVDEFDCDIINLSFGSKRQADDLHDAIKYAVSKGAIVVCSTGNEGTDEMEYPGAYEETIGVGSVNKSKNASSFSHRNTSIFVTAPGENTISLKPDSRMFKLGSGTSYSAPYISGLAALLKEKFPAMTKDDFAEILKASSEDLGEKGYDTTYGWGLIQVPQAIREADKHFGVETSEPDEPAAPSKPSFFQRILDFFTNSWIARLFRKIFNL